MSTPQSDREQMFLKMTREFPDSPMGHFSLGKYYLEAKRFAQSAVSFREAVKLDPEYAAAWLGLADAQVGAGDVDGAKATYGQALQTRHGRKDLSFQEDIEGRMADL